MPLLHSLQPPATNYYDFFGIEHKLSLDLGISSAVLCAKPAAASGPSIAGEPRRSGSIRSDATAILNDAYRTLRDPVQRAEYLLKENGFDIGEQQSKDVPPELLEEVFELNMALEELRSGDDRCPRRNWTGRAKFHRHARCARRRIARNAFRDYDRTGDRTLLAKIRGMLNRRKYVRNLVNQVEKELRDAAVAIESIMSTFQIDFGENKRSGSSASTSAPRTAWSPTWT